LLKDDKFKKLKKSLQDDPEMLELREVIAYDNNGELVVICGNMRLKALQELGVKEVPTKILPTDTSVEKLKAYTIKDNVAFGEHSWEDLANEWDSEQLSDWGVDVPLFNDDMTNNEDYEGLDQLSKLDKFLNAELKRMFLVYDNETFENVVNWFNKQQDKNELENHSQVILKLMENENI
jgi:ParB-like chromosome segregation protein Spo0J